MENLSKVLRRLLHDPDLRGRPVRGHESDFAEVDWEQLAAYGARIEGQVFASPLVGEKGLEDLFAGTIGKIGAAFHRGKFLLSAHYALVTDVPMPERGPSLEEAFYRFVSECFPEAEREARHEFLCAHLQTLALHSRPGFLAYDQVKRIRNGFAAVAGYGEESWLYALVGGKLVAGPVEPECVRVLERCFWGTEGVRASDRAWVTALESLGFQIAPPLKANTLSIFSD